MNSVTQEIANRIEAANRGKVNIHFVYPPIPLRRFDWCATFDNDEPDDEGNILAGYGKTETDALIDLLNNLAILHP